MMNVSNYPVKTMETRSRMSRSLHTNRDFEKLEPYEGKPSRTVLRGEEGSNALDLPDRPSDLQQRDGRGVRAGNEIAKHFAGNNVDVIIYAVEKSLDSYKFNLLHCKQTFISQLKSGAMGARTIDEGAMDEKSGMNFSEYMALLSGNTDLLEKAKLDNKIMQLEKEQGIFKKERIRAERKMNTVQEEMKKADDMAARMTRDMEYIASYTGERRTLLLNLPQATAEETGRELHRIAKTYRSGAYGTIGTYAGLNLLVHSEYGLDGVFERNTFLVEGVSGLKYRCGVSGALPLGFAESAQYPQNTLGRLPSMIDEQRRKMEKMQKEIPALQGIIARKWDKSDELARLKQECKELQQRIDESLKETEQPQIPASELEITDKAA